MKDVIFIPWDCLENWDSFEDYYPAELRGRDLDWEVPFSGVTGWTDTVNEFLPNGVIRDVSQDRYDLDEWGVEDTHLRIRNRLRGWVRGNSGHQIYWIRFYQVPAPKSTRENEQKEREYLENVFQAQERVSNEEWIREPQILLESGDAETILADAKDAKWVADMCSKLNKNYPKIGFVVDLEASPDPEGIVEELPDGSIQKMRGREFDSDISRKCNYEVSRSLLMSDHSQS